MKTLEVSEEVECIELILLSKLLISRVSLIK